MQFLQREMFWTCDDNILFSEQFHKFKTNSALGNIYVQNLDLHSLSNLGGVIRYIWLIKNLGGVSRNIWMTKISLLATMAMHTPQVFHLIVPSCSSGSDRSECEWIYLIWSSDSELLKGQALNKYLSHSYIDECSKMCDVGYSAINIYHGICHCCGNRHHHENQQYNII